MKVLVTGASGFIGRSCVRELASAGFLPIAVLRTIQKKSLVKPHEFVLVPDVRDRSAWTKALRGVDAVVHLAARAHVMSENSENPDAEYARVNVNGTKVLLQCCAEKGIRRFVYLSSIKVNGDATEVVPFSADDPPAPMDPYGRSKRDAELLIRHVCEEHNIDWTIIRPPLVYGPGVKGNFARLIGLVRSGMPMPFGACKNKRAMIYIGNLCSLISQTLSTEASCNKIFLVSDGHDLAVAELIERIGEADGKKVLLFRVPIAVLSALAAALGRSQDLRRLTQPLEIDVSSTYRILGWRPPYGINEALYETLKDWPD